jgi:AraC-like DNA-binding protein
MLPAYREYPPAPALAPWVVCYWTRAAFGPVGEPLVQRVLPDGCADVIFDLGAAAYAVGAMTRALVLTENSSPEMLGIRFRPGRAFAFFSMPLHETTDQRVDLLDLWGKRAAGDIAERVMEQSTMAQRIAIIEAELLRRIGECDPRVDAAVGWITRSGGNLSIERIASNIGISRQHLARQFLQHVGVTPKTFARVVRFERLLREARNGRPDWAALAAELGYFDQAHLIADFRELAGVTPVPFFQSAAGAPP